MKLKSLAMLFAAAVAVGAAAQSEPPLAQRRQLNAGAKPGFGRLLVSLYRDTSEDRLFAVAAGVAFYALLALVPSLAVAVSVFGLFADPERLAKLPAVLGTFLPHEAVTLAQGEAQRLAEQSTGTLSAKLVFALAVSLWSASSAVRALFDALNVIDEQDETRSTLRLYATGLAVTLAGVIVFSLAILLIGADPKLLSFDMLPPGIARLYGLLRWPAFVCVAVFVLAFLYWIGPSRPPAKYLRLLPGAAAAALLWAIGSYAFSWYVHTLGHYSATYGSLATVIVTMTWLWVSAAIVLLGAQLNYELSPRSSAARSGGDARPSQAAEGTRTRA
jgi:membrane protein